MRQVFEQLFGTADDIRALAKAGVSRLITIFVTYVVVHLIIAFKVHEWRNIYHIFWTLIGWYAAWYFIWRVGNRATDAVLVASAAGNHSAQYVVERVRRFFAVIVVIGLGFYWFPAYRSFTTTMAILTTLLLYIMSGPPWSWERFYKFSQWSLGALVGSLLLDTVHFWDFFDDPRNNFSSFPWQVLVLVAIGLIAVNILMKKETPSNHGHH